jgi:hypothetical protein
MSSRSLAAARARRAGENVPPVSGNRPITSIGSQAAFAQQHMPQNVRYNTNIRTARSIQPPHPQKHSPQNAYYEQDNASQAHSNGLPFSKLSVSDAIGLITLRLGRVEQWIIDTDHEEQVNGKSSASSAIPDNHKIIDSSVLTTIINRLDSLEKSAKNNEGQAGNNGQSAEEIAKLSADVKSLTEQITRVGDDVVKHTLELAKNNEQIFRFNRDLTETKDILKTFMLKYDMFAQDITKNFADYEAALGEIEKFLEGDKQVDVGAEGEGAAEGAVEGATEGGSQNEESGAEQTENNVIMSSDLKSIIKQELASNL